MKWRAGWWIAVVLWCGALFALSSIPNATVPLGVRVSDKLLHVLAYLPLGVFSRLSVRQWRPGWTDARQVVLVGLFGALYGASDEIHQAFVPGRASDPWDLLADVVGVVLGALAAVAVARLRGPARALPAVPDR